MILVRLIWARHGYRKNPAPRHGSCSEGFRALAQQGACRCKKALFSQKQSRIMGMEVGMMEVDSVDLGLLAAAASNFASYPGTPSEYAVREFLSRYPFPILFSALAREAEMPELVRTLVEAIQRIFQSSYGTSLLLEVLPYAILGLNADSPLIRQLACTSMAKLLEDGDATSVQAAASCQITSPLLAALCDEDSSVAKAAEGALVHMAKTSPGLELIFTEKGAVSGRLRELATNGPALVRIRALSLAAKIFGLSDRAAAAIQSSGILALLERELGNTNDTLAQVNALELLCELAETHSGRNLLLVGNFVRQLIALTGNFEVEGIVRSRSILVGARLISAVSESDALQIIHAISSCLGRLEELDGNSPYKSEKEAAIEALGQIGSYANGAQFILQGPRPVARHVVHAAFAERGDSLQLAAIHAFASIAGSERTQPVLNEDSENALRSLIFDVVQLSSHRTVSNKILSLLRQMPEIRQATYRLLVPLVSRPWCVWEITSNKDIVDLVVDPRTETSKEAMEWRHACCVALSTALTSAARRGESFPSEVLEKLNAAVRKGPFMAKERVEAIPLVVAEQRF